MSKIQTILREAIGENRKSVTQPAEYKGSDANVWREGYNQALEDLRAKIPEIEKSIVDKIIQEVEKDEWFELSADWERVKDIIKNLTS